MPKPDPLIRLKHMLNAGKEILSLTREKTQEELESDRKLNLAVVRLLEVIGEAANKIPSEDRNLYPEIPWPEIIGLRNRLIHGYDSVDLEIVWQIITDDIPQLARSLEKILGS